MSKVQPSKNKTELFSHVHVVTKPLVQNSLTYLRAASTTLEKFRWHSDRICQILFLEAAQSISMSQVVIQTPVAETKSLITDDNVVIIPIARSGFCILFPALALIPQAKAGFVGLQRKKGTKEVGEYYWNVPKIQRNSIVFVVDPMIATGTSVLHVLQKISQSRPAQIIVVSVIATPQGIRDIQDEFPAVELYTASIDRLLSHHGFIEPGIGDYGDRYFGTV